MSKRPPLHLINGGLPQKTHGIYRLRARHVAVAAVETWPRDGEWRKLVHSLMRNPAKGE